MTVLPTPAWLKNASALNVGVFFARLARAGIYIKIHPTASRDQPQCFASYDAVSSRQKVTPVPATFAV